MLRFSLSDVLSTYYYFHSILTVLQTRQAHQLAICKLDRGAELGSTKKRLQLSGQSGTWTRDLRILSPAPKPLGHAASTILEKNRIVFKTKTIRYPKPILQEYIPCLFLIRCSLFNVFRILWQIFAISWLLLFNVRFGQGDFAKHCEDDLGFKVWWNPAMAFIIILS